MSWAMLDALLEKCREPVSSRPIAFFRIAFGSLMVILVARYLTHSWIHEYYVEPTYFFGYPGLSWARPLPAPWPYVQWGLLGLFALCIALGFFQRIASALFFVSFVTAHFSDKTEYLNHYYLVALLSLLLAVIPASQVMSIDAWRNPSLEARSSPSWHLWLLRFQIAVVYFYGGVGKLNADWLLHAQPLKIWLSSLAGLPLLGPVLAYPATAFFMSWAGAIFDLSVPFALWFRRLRPFAFAALIAFHLCTFALFQIGMFPWIMMASALSLWGVESTLGDAECGDDKSVESGLSASRAPLYIAFGYVLFQALFPLRSLLYPGNVNWTEEGFRFSWKVMLIEKSGSVQFKVREPDGRAWVVEPRELFTPFQVKMLSTQPDMILQAAHFVAADARAHGHQDVEVRADALVSFNGRPAQRIIDPNVDLAHQNDTIFARPWVLPLR
ncbi:MAG: HTTM domain-containing protein [Polyangiaceae bacterium]